MLRLDINLLFTVINLLVLYFFAKKFLFGRVNQILEERKALIEKKFADAKTAQDTADGMKTEYEGKLAAAAGEGKEIIARAENEARLQSEKMLAAAETELEQKRRRAEEEAAERAAERRRRRELREAERKNRPKLFTPGMPARRRRYMLSRVIFATAFLVVSTVLLGIVVWVFYVSRVFGTVIDWLLIGLCVPAFAAMLFVYARYLATLNYEYDAHYVD